MYSQYVDFTVDEFAVDPYFRKWCLSDDTDVEAFWRVFLQHHPDRAEAIEQARQIVTGTSDYFKPHIASGKEIEASYQKMLQSAKRLPRSNRSAYRRYWSVAATVALLLVAMITIGYLTSESTRETTLANYQTDYGEQQTIQLPDGSAVQLNANSTLTLDEQWNANTRREVWLAGEAYFSVEKKSATQAKFVVHTQGLTIEVLGTQFNVNTTEKTTQVVLDEGQVRLLTADDSDTRTVTMMPGEVVSYSKFTNEIDKQRTSTRPYSTWKDGYLTYQAATLSEVLGDVHNTFGYTIVVRDSLLLNETITGALSAQDINALLVVLEDVVPQISFTKKGRQLIVNSKE